ncbi:hypothetical protein JDV02_008858 [Purpureocillium takamizusanense]|uniref:Zn(2)-C6 fungal-type domain-containing protein n=1 Tax=Purpureocillium takamizusanense TaxID=2060973 RepID=A0A9Q8QR82_9HYPO|nr:uncharacterized protein JDV02_008858 [Purpureocillium takamizusanense]UNI23017.1 hypothetical protein JDV02_008858 [Purpureocillium takamizusanense]
MQREPPPTHLRPRRTRSNVCSECRRQKQKCDRQTPCGNCVRREVVHLCQLPLPPPPPPPPGPNHRRRTAPAARTRPQQDTPSRDGRRRRLINVSPTYHQQQQPPSRSRASSADSPHVGRLWNTRGAKSYHGSSYFGHQSAASIMDMESPELPVGISGIHANSSRRDISRNEKSPHDHIWELVGYLPRRKAVVDHLVQRYLDELNPVHDCVQPDDFRATYDAFWDRKWGDDDLTTVDLRWLALLFMVLAFSEMVDCPMDASPETQERCEERSIQYFWASRKAIVLAPTFSGESLDLVSAGILVSQYLIYFGRKTESWLTSSFAIRMAQAQGMHIDGEIWGLPARALETRRRLWCKLYALDRSVALAVGRPYTIHSKHCMEMDVKNVCIDDIAADDVDSVARELPLSSPTRNVYYMYQQRLSTILGDIHDECFGISSLSGSYSTYEKVLGLDQVLLDWAESLPPYFRLDDPDQSLDAGRPYLYWQRIYLHSGYHFARVTLHRKYVLLVSITDRFQHSRDACISSACADLKLKLGFRHLSMASRLMAGGAMHNLFNSALVLAVIAVREPLLPRTAAIVEDLSAYCEKQRTDPWVNAFALAEVKVIELCIASAVRARQEGRAERLATTTAVGNGRGMEAQHAHDPLVQAVSPRMPQPQAASLGSGPGVSASSLDFTIGAADGWLDTWFGLTRSFQEPIDYDLWEDLVENLEAHP